MARKKIEKLSVNIHLVAYIAIPRLSVRELIDSLNSWADGGESICISVETLEDDIKKLKGTIKKQLKQAIAEIGSKAGDVILYAD